MFSDSYMKKRPSHIKLYYGHHKVKEVANSPIGDGASSMKESFNGYSSLPTMVNFVTQSEELLHKDTLGVIKSPANLYKILRRKESKRPLLQRRNNSQRKLKQRDTLTKFSYQPAPISYSSSMKPPCDPFHSTPPADLVTRRLQGLQVSGSIVKATKEEPCICCGGKCGPSLMGDLHVKKSELLSYSSRKVASY